jgi:dTDP-4-amino-4,6-dideoxygalactose transaminase
MQAAVGVAQLQHLDTVLERRAQQEQRYMRLFEGNHRVIWRPKADWCDTVHWMSTITLRQSQLRTPLLEHLLENGIEARQMVYPVHTASPFLENCDPAEFPVSRSVSLRSLHLPSSLDLTISDQQLIAELVQEWLQRHDP